MRPDVKLGVVISMVVVLVAGGYFIFRGRDEAPVPVADGSGSLSGQASDPSSAKTPDKNRGRADQTSKTPAAPTGGARRTTPAPATRSDGKPVPGSRQARGPDATTGRPVPGSVTRRDGAAAGPAGGTPERPTTTPTVSPPEATGVSATPAVEGGRTADAGSSGRPGEAERDRQPAPDTAGSAAAPPVAPGAATTVADASGRPTSAPDGAIALTAAVTPTVPPTRGPAGGPAAVGRSETTGGPAAVDTHRVQEGDTLSSLARRYYGGEQHARFLAESNPQLPDPNRLAVGAVVKIPPLPSPSGDTGLSSSPAPGLPGSSPPAAGAPGRTYRVQPGDSFYTIARETLHDAARWKELFELNKELVKGDARRLQVGQVITLPPP